MLRSKKYWRFVPTLLAVAVLCACGSKGDNYQKPEMPLPAAFKESALWKPANPQAAAVPDDWWLLFNDPVLTQLEAQVIVGNETLKANAAQYRIARAAVDSARSALYPTLGVGASASRADPGGAAGPSNSFQLSGSANWEVDLWGRVAGEVSAAQARLQASADDVAAARLSIQATLAQTYLSLRSTEAQETLLQSTLVAFQRSYDLTQNRYNAGVASAADVAQAESQLKATQAQLLDVTASRAQLEHAVAVLLGKAPADLNIARTGVLPGAPEVPTLLPATLLERRPDIAAAERRVAAANAQIGVAQSAFFPDLTLSAAAGFRSASLGSLISAPNLFWSIGPALALTVFDGGARRAAVESARASTELAAANYRQTVLTALQEVEDNLVLGSSLQEQDVVQTQALAAARRGLEITNNQYRAGTVSFLNVAAAQADALGAERTLLALRSRRLAAINQLLKNIAGRWDKPVS